MANNDHWTLDLKDLGMEGAGEELARLILSCQPPYAVCVQGKWGSGKTSLMRYVMARLGGEPLGTTVKTSKDPIGELPDWLTGRWQTLGNGSKAFIEGRFSDQRENPDHDLPESRIVPIWFNPWQHQNADMPLVALLQELRAQFTYLVQFGRFAGKLAQNGVEAGLRMIGHLVDTFVSLKGLPKLGLGQGGARDIQRRDFEDLHDAQRLNILFEQAVQRLLSSTVEDPADIPMDRHGHPLALRRLVVFIDDLDRCSEEQTVRLLEAIKLYLQTRYCVFVFGMDGAAAQRAVRNVLPHKSLEEAQEYLEKLFQATIHVPIPSNYRPFVEGLLEAAGLDAASTTLEPADLANWIVRLVEPNPRKLKNFVNTLAVGWSVRRSCGGPEIRFSLFLLLSFLRNYHPEAYRLLAYDPAHAGDLQKVLHEGLKNPAPNSSPVYYGLVTK
jgi:KAP family P-loop domain